MCLAKGGQGCPAGGEAVRVSSCQEDSSGVYMVGAVLHACPGVFVTFVNVGEQLETVLSGANCRVQFCICICSVRDIVVW